MSDACKQSPAVVIEKFWKVVNTWAWRTHGPRRAELWLLNSDLLHCYGCLALSVTTSHPRLSHCAAHQLTFARPRPASRSYFSPIAPHTFRDTQNMPRECAPATAATHHRHFTDLLTLAQLLLATKKTARPRARGRLPTAVPREWRSL